MTKGKTKEKDEVLRRKRRVQAPSNPAKANEQVSLEDIWKDEMNRLAQQEFPTAEAAIEAIAGQVAERMGIPSEHRDGFREEVLKYLKDDPVIKEVLEESLHIKK